MTNEKFDALFGGPPRKPDELADAASHGSRRVDPGRDRRDRAAADALGRRGNRRRESLPRRRRRAQLRRQRQGSARRQIRATSGSSRRRATPAARWAPRSPPIICSPGPAPRRSATARRRCRAPISARLRAGRNRDALARCGRVFRGASGRARMLDRRPPTLWPTARPSAGSRAAWSSARARWAAARSSATRARPTMQSMLNLKVKYRECFRPFAPSVLREDVADWFELDGDSPYMLLVADVAEDRRRTMTAEEQQAVRDRQAQCAAFRDPRRDPCRLLGARADRASRDQPALPRADLRVQGAHRLPGAGQHQLQRARRADRLHAGRRLSLLHGHRDRACWRSATVCCARKTRIRR